MSNVHRILWFDQEVRQLKYPNCKSLAEHFEISFRQANRDMEYLKNTLNAPLKYVAAKRGFVYEDLSFILPSMIITSEEKKVLSFLAYKYENYDDTINNQRVSKLFRNLSNQIENNEKIPFFNTNKDYLTSFDKITGSINNHKKIFLSYMYPTNIIKKLVIHPYNIFGKGENDFLAAFCEDYGEVCIFRLDRVMEIKTSDQMFTVKKEYKLEDYIPLVKKPFKAILELKSDQIVNTFMGRKAAQISEKSYEIEFHDSEQFITDLISSKAWTNIVSPIWLKERIVARCTEIIKKIDTD